MLKADYTFEAHRLNDVPICLYFMTHTYFMVSERERNREEVPNERAGREQSAPLAAESEAPASKADTSAPLRLWWAERVRLASDRYASPGYSRLPPPFPLPHSQFYHTFSNWALRYVRSAYRAGTARLVFECAVIAALSYTTAFMVRWLF